MTPKNARNASTDDQHNAQSLQAAYQELVEGQKALQLEREALIAWQQQWQQHFQQREANVAQRETDVAHREAVVKERTYASETVRHNPYQLPKAVCLNRKQAALQHEKRVLDAQREEQEQERRALTEQKEAQEQERRALTEQKEVLEQEHRVLKEQWDALQHSVALHLAMHQHEDKELQKKREEQDDWMRAAKKTYNKAMRKAIAKIRKALGRVRIYQAREAVVRAAVDDFAYDIKEGHLNGSLSVLGAVTLVTDMTRQVEEGFREFPAFDHPGYSAAWDNHGFEEDEEDDEE